MTFARQIALFCVASSAAALRPGWEDSAGALGAERKRERNLQSFQVLTSAHISRPHAPGYVGMAQKPGDQENYARREPATSGATSRRQLQQLAAARIKDKVAQLPQNELQNETSLDELVDVARTNSLANLGFAFFQESQSIASEHNAIHEQHQQPSAAEHELNTSRASAESIWRQHNERSQINTDDDDEEEAGRQAVQNISAAEILAGTPAPLLNSDSLLGGRIRKGVSVPMWLLALMSIGGGMAFSWRLYSIWNRRERCDTFPAAGGAETRGLLMREPFGRHASEPSVLRGITAPLAASNGARWCSFEKWTDLAFPQALGRISIERLPVPDQVHLAQSVQPELVHQLSAAMDGTPSPEVRNWAAKSLADVFLVLGLPTDGLKTGLQNEEALRRLATHGKNEFNTAGLRSLLQIFVQALLGKTGVLLLLAAVLAVGFFDYLDGALLVIGYLCTAAFAVVSEKYLISGSLVVAQEQSLKARCLRDGTWQRIAAAELVPGDVVRLCAGDRVAADLRVVAADGLWVDESLFSGVYGQKAEKHGMVEALDEMCGLAENIVYAQTNVIRGSCVAIVVETGMNTRLGRLHKLLSKAADVTNKTIRLMSSRGLQALHSIGGPSIALCLLVNILSFLARCVWGYHDPDAPCSASQGWRCTWLRAAQDAILLSIKVLPQMFAPWCAICLTVGSECARQKGALVRKLNSATSLSSCTTVCADMTGVFTENCFSAVNIFGSLPEPHTFEFDRETNNTDGASRRGSVYLLDRSSRPRRIDQDLSICDSKESSFVKGALSLACMNCRDTLSQELASGAVEVPIAASARLVGLEPIDIWAAFPSVLEVPFASAHKFQATVHALPAGSHVLSAFQLPAEISHLAVLKGAPERLLPHLTRGLAHSERGGGWEPSRRDSDLLQGLVEAQSSRFAADSLRVLLCAMLPLTQREFDALEAMGDLDACSEALLQDLVFVSLLSFRDPLRERVRPAVDRCLLAGIRVVLITGEQLETSQAVARSIGIPGKAQLAATLRLSCGALRPSAEILDLCAEVSIWSRVQPEDKLAIMTALQESETVCVVTGGSVDDVAVLQQADVGVALGSGQAVAKHAADIVLMGPDVAFTGVVDALEGSRHTTSILMKAVVYWLGVNIGEFLAHTTACMVGMPKAFSSLSLLISLAMSTLGVLPLCWEPPDEDSIPSVRQRDISFFSSRRLAFSMWLSIPVVMLFTMYVGLSVHVGAVQSDRIIGLCDYAWHLEDTPAHGSHSQASRTWRRDDLPYHCGCPAHAAGEQWGRQQSTANNIAAEFSRISGSSGRAYALDQGPFSGTDLPLEPCRDLPGASSTGEMCWKEPFLKTAWVVQSDGNINTIGDERPVYENVVLHGEWNCARYGTRLAKTMAWLSTILTEALFLQSVRSPQPLHHVFWRNSKAAASLFAILMMALLVIYAPALQDAVQLAPLPLPSLLLACVGPMVALGLTEAAKAAMRRQSTESISHV